MCVTRTRTFIDVVMDHVKSIIMIMINCDYVKSIHVIMRVCTLKNFHACRLYVIVAVCFALRIWLRT